MQNLQPACSQMLSRTVDPHLPMPLLAPVTMIDLPARLGRALLTAAGAADFMVTIGRSKIVSLRPADCLHRAAMH